ncbi:MAG TPA: hypothetical protein PKI32_05835, partial [Opitutales bacterium]|nr:hypothetical protein [Opitutales bacterium]
MIRDLEPAVATDELHPASRFALAMVAKAHGLEFLRGHAAFFGGSLRHKGIQNHVVLHARDKDGGDRRIKRAVDTVAKHETVVLVVHDDSRVHVLDGVREMIL